MDEKKNSLEEPINTPKLCWLFLIISLGLNMISIDVYLPAMPKMAEELNTTPFLLKLIFIINFIFHRINRSY